MDFALKIRANFLPVPIKNIPKVIVLPPILGNRTINFTGHLIFNGLWIAIISYRRKDGLMDIKLPSRTALCSQHQLKVVYFLKSISDLTKIISGARS